MKLGQILEIVFVMAFLSVVEAFALYALYYNEMDGQRFAIIHTSLILTGAIWLYDRVNRRNKDGRNGAVMVMAFAVGGLAGTLGYSFYLVAHHIVLIFMPPAKDWQNFLIPDIAEDHIRDLYDDILDGRSGSQKQHEAISFADLLNYGTLQQKQEVVALITTNFRPAFAPVLLEAVNNSVPAIRFQAASAIAEIEEQFVSRDLELTAKAAENPDDFNAQYKLAQHLDDYAYSGILGEEREKDCRIRAFEIFKTCNQLDSQSAVIVARIVRLLIRNKQYHKADEWINRYTDNDEVYSQLLEWHFEVLYLLEKYDQLRSKLAKYKSRPCIFCLKTQCDNRKEDESHQCKNQVVRESMALWQNA